MMASHQPFPPTGLRNGSFGGQALGMRPPGHRAGPRQGRRSLVVSADSTLTALGTDFLLFLGATVLVIPTFKAAKQSPILGYLFAGFMLG